MAAEASRLLCNSRCVLVGTVGWPADGPVRGLPHAATVVCASQRHQSAAAQWVRARTEHDGVFSPYRKRGEA